MTVARKPKSSGRPLIVDLDGTLVPVDLLVEQFASVASKDWRAALGAIAELRRGKSALKAAVAEAGELQPALLPYDPAVIALVRKARDEGRPVYLATASHQLQADAIARHLGLFDGVFATNADVNLAGPAKARLLVEHFGERGFDYIGNHSQDLSVWKYAHTALAVRASAGVRRRLNRLNVRSEIVECRRSGVRDWIRALRVHQYSKNLLIFVPLLAGHAHLLSQWLAASMMFAAFCVAASSAYLLNDLLDLEADRQHPTKVFRPLASGAISTQGALVAIPILFLSAIALSAIITPFCPLVVAGYLLLTLGYSFYLKRRMLVDVVALALLYTIRIIAGSVASGISPSEWLLAFSLFAFSSLAIIKRYTEVAGRLDRNLVDISHRNYRKEDLVVLASLAAATGTNAVTVFAMYVNSPAVTQLYSHPKLLWLICPLLLYLLGRALMVSNRREMHDDPVVWALRDRICRIGLFVSGLIALAAL
ncbi:MAG: UbiA family prenyltransferase [Sphingomonas sp.]|nr:UbiA family prenyltransferase [Sphingomonas sp.]